MNEIIEGSEGVLGFFRKDVPAGACEAESEICLVPGLKPERLVVPSVCGHFEITDLFADDARLQLRRRDTAGADLAHSFDIVDAPVLRRGSKLRLRGRYHGVGSEAGILRGAIIGVSYKYKNPVDMEALFAVPGEAALLFKSDEVSPGATVALMTEGSHFPAYHANVVTFDADPDFDLVEVGADNATFNVVKKGTSEGRTVIRIEGPVIRHGQRLRLIAQNRSTNTARLKGFVMGTAYEKKA